MVVRVGIVGCGIIGRRLALAFAEHEETEIVAVCDIDGERASTMASEYDCEYFTNPSDLLIPGKIDLVYVGVPPKFHPEVALEALDAGIHVLCEKPIAINSKIGDEMVTIADIAGRKTGVNYPFRYTPSMHLLKEMLENGELGTVRKAILKFRFPQWPRGWQQVDWLRTHEQGGPLREVGSHFFFGLLELLGPVKRVNTVIEYHGEGLSERVASGIIELESGIPVILDLLTDTSDEEENTLTIIGDSSTISLVGWYKLIQHYRTDQEIILNDLESNSSLMVVNDMVQAISDDPNTLVDFKIANETQKILDAIYDSKGSWIEIE